ncbi:MAG: hypothetical protein GPOALKHO_000586 [Sodalis sp.]|nr:MAG: hypothetical protein GPOALKHO_000586 [Sodalis sp.]
MVFASQRVGAGSADVIARHSLGPLKRQGAIQSTDTPWRAGGILRALNPSITCAGDLRRSSVYRSMEGFTRSCAAQASSSASSAVDSATGQPPRRFQRLTNSQNRVAVRSVS